MHDTTRACPYALVAAADLRIAHGVDIGHPLADRPCRVVTRDVDLGHGIWHIARCATHDHEALDPLPTRQSARDCFACDKGRGWTFAVAEPETPHQVATVDVSGLLGRLVVWAEQMHATRTDPASTTAGGAGQDVVGRDGAADTTVDLAAEHALDLPTLWRWLPDGVAQPVAVQAVAVPEGYRVWVHAVTPLPGSTLAADPRRQVGDYATDGVTYLDVVLRVAEDTSRPEGAIEPAHGRLFLQP